LRAPAAGRGGRGQARRGRPAPGAERGDVDRVTAAAALGEPAFARGATLTGQEAADLARTALGAIARWSGADAADVAGIVRLSP
jgi:hypothetical protein